MQPVYQYRFYFRLFDHLDIIEDIIEIFKYRAFSLYVLNMKKGVLLWM